MTQVSANASIVILQHVSAPEEGVSEFDHQTRGGGSALFAARVTAEAPGVLFTRSLLVGGRQFLAASQDGEETGGGAVLYELGVSVNGSTNLTAVQNVSGNARCEP